MQIRSLAWNFIKKKWHEYVDVESLYSSSEHKFLRHARKCEFLPNTYGLCKARTYGLVGHWSFLRPQINVHFKRGESFWPELLFVFKKAGSRVERVVGQAGTGRAREGYEGIVSDFRCKYFGDAQNNEAWRDKKRFISYYIFFYGLRVVFFRILNVDPVVKIWRFIFFKATVQEKRAYATKFFTPKNSNTKYL